MYDPPGYPWALTIAGMIAIPAATCLVLYGGAVRAGLSRRRAALLAGGAAVVLGSWFTASAVIAGHAGYHARLGHGVPWLPVAVAGFLALLLALRRIPVVARALSAPGMVSRLELPHTFRVVEGTAFLLIMFLGHLPALFALPAGLGDMVPASPHRWSRTGSRGRPPRPVVHRVRHGRSGERPGPRRPHRIRADQCHPVRCADQRTPARADPDSRRAAAAHPAHHVRVRAAQSPPSTAASHRPAHRPREIEENRIQLEIDALKEAAAGPGARQRTTIVPAAGSWPPRPTRRAIRPQDCTPGVGPVNGKETQ